MCNHITHLVCIQPFSRRGWIPAGKPWTYPRSKKKTNNTCLFFVGWSPYGKPLNLNPWGFREVRVPFSLGWPSCWPCRLQAMNLDRLGDFETQLQTLNLGLMESTWWSLGIGSGSRDVGSWSLECQYGEDVGCFFWCCRNPWKWRNVPWNWTILEGKSTSKHHVLGVSCLVWGE